MNQKDTNLRQALLRLTELLTEIIRKYGVSILSEDVIAYEVRLEQVKQLLRSSCERGQQDDHDDCEGVQP